MSRGRQHKRYLARAHAMGGHTTVPAGETVQVLTDLHQRMSMTAIARGIGTSHNYVSKVIRGQLKRMSPERHAAIMALRGYQPTDTSHIDVTGARRRLQSLHALGYSLARIEREVGCYSLGAIKDLVHGRTPVMEAQHATAIAAAYERLSMRLPVAANKYEAGGITRARNTARRNGWPPPLAWDDIDDPDERPVGWRYGDNDTGRGRELIDEVVVQRLVDHGERTRKLSPAESAQAVRILLARGVGVGRIESDYGLVVSRYEEVAS